MFAQILFMWNKPIQNINSRRFLSILNEINMVSVKPRQKTSIPSFPLQKSWQLMLSGKKLGINLVDAVQSLQAGIRFEGPLREAYIRGLKKNQDDEVLTCHRNGGRHSERLQIVLILMFIPTYGIYLAVHRTCIGMGVLWGGPHLACSTVTARFKF